MKIDKILLQKIFFDGEIFLSVLLVLCSIGKIHWGWFWFVLIVGMVNTSIWMKYAEDKIKP